MRMRSWGILLALSFAIFSARIFAGDWPQLLGPTRNGVYAGGDLAAAWPASGPPIVWRKEIGEGFAAPVIAGGKLVLFHRRAGKEIVDCLNAGSGERIWSYDYPTNYRDDFGFDEGPRSAPTIAGGVIYTFGAQGVLTAIDFATGNKKWSVAADEQFGVRKGFFGAAGSPLVEGGRVMVNVGGPNAGIVAFDANSGAVVWKATSDEASYSSPTVATIDGARHALFFTRAGLVDLDPANGQVRFSMPFRSRSSASVNAATPLVIGNQVFVSASYGTGAVLLEVKGSAYRKIWANDESMSNHYSTSVYRDGFLYGFHGRQEEVQSLRCIEWKTGNVMWNIDRFGAGTVTLAGDRLLILRENGELMTAPATPAGFHPAAHARIASSVVRAYPALTDGYLYARDEHSLICVKLK